MKQTVRVRCQPTHPHGRTCWSGVKTGKAPQHFVPHLSAEFICSLVLSSSHLVFAGAGLKVIALSTITQCRDILRHHLFHTEGKHMQTSQNPKQNSMVPRVHLFVTSTHRRQDLQVPSPPFPRGHKDTQQRAFFKTISV